MQESFKIPTASFPSVSGAVCSFDSQYAGLPLKAHTVAIDYTGSAISGVHIQNTCGVNQWDEEWENGVLNTTTGANRENVNAIRTKNYVRVLPNTTYYCSATYGSGYAIWCMFYDNNNNVITGYSTGKSVYENASEIRNSSFVTPSNCSYIRFYITPQYGNTYNNNVSINFPATNTSYNAFVGQLFNITFNTPIYGGSYDCLTGIVTSDKDSGGGDVSPTYQQTATANCETSLGQNNILADTGDTTLQYIKLG